MSLYGVCMHVYMFLQSSYNEFLSSVLRLISHTKKQGAGISNIIKTLSKTIFCQNEDFLRFKVKQEGISKAITS